MDIQLHRRSKYRTLCQFSKKIIKPGHYVSNFNRKQYDYFNNTIHDIFIGVLSDDIIDIIIEKTNYKKYIDHWGLTQYVDWAGEHANNALCTSDESNNDSDADSDNDSDNDNNSDYN